MSTSVLKALPGKLDIKDTPLVFSINGPEHKRFQYFIYTNVSSEARGLDFGLRIHL